MSIKLGRILKILSTILIAVGVAYLFLFVRQQNRSLLDIFDRPSYYVTQNYRLFFLAGIAAVAFSVLGSFFSWSDKIDPPKQVLMNAGYTSQKDIDTWLKGSAADEETRRQGTETAVEDEAGKTAELGIPEDKDGTADTTVIGQAEGAGETTVITQAEEAGETTVITQAEETGETTVISPEENDGSGVNDILAGFRQHREGD